MDDFKTRWRPAAGWAFVAITASITIAVVYALVEGSVSVVEASPLLMAIVAAYTPIVSLYVHGRTQEKKAGVQDDSLHTEPDGQEYSDNIDDFPSTTLGS